MMNFGALFDDYFSTRNGVSENAHPCVSEEVSACCSAVLRNGVCPDSLSLTADEKRVVEEWTSRYNALIERAKRLALAGEARSGLAFDELKKQSMAIADEVFQRPQRGDVFSRVALAFDQAAAGLVGETDQVDESEQKMIPWTEFPFLEQPVFRAVNEIQRLASWDDSYKGELERCCAEFRRRYPKEVTWMAIAIQNGEICREIKNRAHGLAFRSHGKSELEKLLKKVGIPDWLAKKVREDFAAGAMSKARDRAAKKIKRQEKRRREKRGESQDVRAATPFANVTSDPVSLVADGLHQNSILNLNPAKRWTIVSDETGTKFGNEAFVSGKSRGRYAMVMVPEGSELPGLPGGWHAVDKTLDEQLCVAEDLHKSGCGILGIPVTDLAQTNRDLWFACIEALLDIALRLLPVDGETEIELKVEQRGGKNSNNASLLDRTLDPEIRLTVTMQVAA